jgi:hypothetical protein
MMSRHRIRSEPLPGRGDRLPAGQPVAGAPLWGGPLRPDGRAPVAGPPLHRTTTCPVCESPVAVEGMCMGCWEVC